MKPADFAAQVDAIVERVEGPDVRLWEDAPDRRLKLQFRLNSGDEINRFMRANGWRYVGGPVQIWVRRLDKFSRASAVLVLAGLRQQQPEWKIEAPEEYLCENREN